jgi:hypothetical protein
MLTKYDIPLRRYIAGFTDYYYRYPVVFSRTLTDTVLDLRVMN